MRLSGYGVELAVKSTEYKNVDDQKVEDSKTNAQVAAESLDHDEIDGFLFSRLRFVYRCCQSICTLK